MTELKHEIYIEAPTEKVWKTLANLEAVAKYNPGVAKAKYISVEKEGIGAARECELKQGGKVKERVIGWNPRENMTIELFESSWPVVGLKWTTRLTPEKNGTLVTQSMTYRPKGLLGSIMNVLIMKRMMRKTLDQIFVSMKRYIENES